MHAHSKNFYFLYCDFSAFSKYFFLVTLIIYNLPIAHTLLKINLSVLAVSLGLKPFYMYHSTLHKTESYISETFNVLIVSL